MFNAEQAWRLQANYQPAPTWIHAMWGRFQQEKENTMKTCTNCSGAGGHQVKDDKGNVISETMCNACGGVGQVPAPPEDPINPN